MSIDKKDIIKLLETIAIYLELKGENSFKVSAYRKAAQALEVDERSLSEIDEFTSLSGIGKGTASVIEDYINNGYSETLKQLKEQVPNGLIPLLSVSGLGGKKLSKLYQQLGVTDKESLISAIKQGEVEKLNGFGKKSAEKMLKALEEQGARPERLPLAFVLPVVEKIEDYLQQIKTIKRFSRAGSVRRMRETVKDLDFIITSSDPDEIKDQLLSIPNIKEVISAGETKVSVVLDEMYEIGVDFRIVAEDEFATTLHHFTGSKDHNVAMRQLAKSQGEKINEYGIENIESGQLTTFENEHQFFHHFGLNFIPPELRQDGGEIEAFRSDVSLVDIEDIRGDLHMHTTWSDGAQSVEEMVVKAIEKEYEYIAITDHSKYLRVANGLDETRIRKQREEINRLNDKYPELHIFSGIEMDILPDASLDFSNDFLQELDYVIAAIHSNFNQSEDKIMQRLFAALENPYVNVIAHPTGRLIGRRDGYQVDVDKLIQKAKETGTVLELNANPNRFDLSHQWVKQAQEIGVPIVINTDAHSYRTLEYMDIGVTVARKGWLKKESVINTWPKEKLMELFSSKRLKGVTTDE